MSLARGQLEKRGGWRGYEGGEVGRGDERQEENGWDVCENVGVRKVSETTAEADRDWNQNRRDGWGGGVTGRVTGDR